MTNLLIRLATALIPAKTLRKRLRRKWLDRAILARLNRGVPRIRACYGKLAATAREKLARGEKLRVAFLICDAAMFSGESVFRRMSQDQRFDCFIAVAPRITRGEAFLRETLRKTVGLLSERYGKVVPLYDPDSGKSLPIDADIVFSTVVYEDQTLPRYTTERLSERALVICLYYGYGGLFTSNTKRTVFLPNIVFSWKYFVSNEATRTLWIEKNPLLKDNLEVSGYAKMDRLEEEIRRAAEHPRSAKTVVICPHHSIERDTDGLKLSTFLIHADLFQRLPKIFPDVKFVFRPHPLLFARLATPKWWGEAKTAEYRAALEANPNVEFQQGGDYFATFAVSDALIHDCGSFIAEYFYVGKPQCYMLENDRTLDQFLPFCRRMVDHAYRAFTDDDIVNFIRDVVIGDRDPMRTERDDFAKREVCVNHPDATSSVINAILSGIAAAK